GIITQAWMRLQDRPKFRDGGAVRFKDFFSSARAVRAISQAGLYPSNCRILDPAEAYNTGAADGSVAIMVLAFESADHHVAATMTAARPRRAAPRRPVRAPPACGATPSSACPTRWNG